MDPYKRVISPLTDSVVGTNSGVYGSIDRGAEPLPVLQKISESENDYDLHGDSPAAPNLPTTALINVSTSSEPTSGQINWSVHRRDSMRRMSGSPPLHRHVTIGVLPGATLLKIFEFYRMSSLSHWHRLAHVCRKWRSILFASARRLDLRLYCTPGTPVSKTLDCWPTLPIVVKYGGSPALGPLFPEDEDNIVAALKRPDRISSIHLTVTRSLLEKLSTIKKRFSELEDLVLLSQDNVQLTIPSAFRWGSRLRTLHSTGVAFVSLPQLLLSSRNLVDIRLHKIPNIEYSSPEALVDVLSGMTQLRSLSLYLRSSASHPEDTGIPLSSVGTRVSLPVLTHLKFRGTSEFLDRFVAIIDSPLLGDVEIAFNQPIFHVSIVNLVGFIDRIEAHKSYRRADILSSESATSISFTQPGVSTHLKFKVFSEPSIRHIFVSQICKRFSTFLAGVEDLRVNAARPSRVHYKDREEWLKLIHRFRGAKWFHVAGNYSTDIIRALQLPYRRRETVLPILHKLCIQEPEPRYAPLREAVASFMESRWLSGRLIEVECEPLRITKLGGTVPEQATIEVLYDDILLNIFIHFLDASPQFWPTLVHVCQNWRRIVFSSPQGLHLRLYCKHGTPVSKTLDFWPPLPIVVQYGGAPTLDPPAPEDDDNIIAALKQSGRVSSISLTVTSSLLEKLSAISEPFSELEELALLSEDDMQLTLPSTFRWGLRLRTLHSTRIAFPSFPQLLSPSQNLVDLQLHEIPSVGYFSPEAFANALSGKTQLQSLSLHFLSLPSRRNYLVLPPTSEERVVLPALSSLKYRGTTKYLDCLVARIDAPRLEDIDITFFSQPTLDASQLGRFIDRIGILKSHCRASIRSSDRAISICFTNQGTPIQLALQVSCEQLDWQLSSMSQICDQFSPFLFRIRDLDINTTQPSTVQDDADSEHLGEHWLDFHSFGGVEKFYLAGKLTTNILRTLQAADWETCPLPVLKILYVQGPESGSLSVAIDSFVTSRWLSGRPIKVEGIQATVLPNSTVSEHEDGQAGQLLLAPYTCQDCNARFAAQRDLTRHFQNEHEPQRCAFCSFTWSPRSPYSYGIHLRQYHPGVEPASVLSFHSRQHSFPTFHPDRGIQPNDLHAQNTCGPTAMIPRTRRISGLGSGRLDQILRGLTDDPYPADPSSSDSTLLCSHSSESDDVS